MLTNHCKHGIIKEWKAERRKPGGNEPAIAGRGGDDRERVKLTTRVKRKPNPRWQQSLTLHAARQPPSHRNARLGRTTWEPLPSGDGSQ
ncbi:hypothetical protein [Nostoc sp.]